MRLVGREVEHARHEVAAHAPEQLRLAVEARDEVLIVRRGVAHRLDGDLVADGDVLARPDLPGRAGAELPLDAVAPRDDLPRLKLHAGSMIHTRAPQAEPAGWRSERATSGALRGRVGAA